jgi:hypothetical protein
MQIRTVVSFQWFTANRHELAPEGKAEPGEVRHFQSVVQQTIPKAWRRKIRAIDPPGLKKSPLEDPGLFRRFANLTYDPDCYLDFVNQFGLLVDRNYQRLFEMAAFRRNLRAALGRPPRDVPSWLAEYFQLLAVHHWDLTDQVDNPRLGENLTECRAFDSDPLAHLNGVVRYGIRTAVERAPETNRMMLVVRPHNLCVAIALQAVAHLSGYEEEEGIKLFQCAWCGSYFKVGTGTGRRSRSKFCSRKCQDAHSNSLKKLRREGALGKVT